MKYLWVDTETTGLKPEDSAPFQIAMILEDTSTTSSVEKVFYLNPYDIDGIEHHKSAEAVHGYTKKQIQRFEESKFIVPEVEDFLDYCERFNSPSKLTFVAYNSPFDFSHLESLFAKYNIDFSKHFDKEKPVADVLEQVKEAFETTKIFEGLGNKRLTTVAEHLGIKMKNAHDALCDIKTAQEVSRILIENGVSL